MPEEKKEKVECYCKTCHKTMLEENFYLSKNIEKYPPNGRLDECKKCLTMHVNNWEPSTFLHILQKIDVPYIETEWNALLEKYGKDPKKTSSTAIIGRYLAKMKLKQYQNYSFADTERIQGEIDRKKGIVKKQQDDQLNRYAAALQNGDLKQFQDISEDDLEHMSEEELATLIPQPDLPPIFFSIEDEVTEDEKKMLSMKWGKLYKVEEWVSLEKFYQEMMDSYDIQTAAHIDYLKKICKTSLKMDQAIDCGDIEGFQKLSKVYDSLMKSAKFTAAQNKAVSDDYIDSLGEMVSLCEEKGFIQRFHTDEPQDVVDVTLNDNKAYVRKLIMEEMNLGNMIEAALQQMQRQEEQEEGELDDNDDYLNPDFQEVLEDADYEEFSEFVDDQHEADLDTQANEKEVK